jgi:translation initiation factor 2 subunit 2
MEDYEKLLESAYQQVKPITSTGIRFDVPKAKSVIEGYKTIFVNFGEICSYLKRPKAHVEKFLEKEVAIPGKIDGDRLIFAGKVSGVKLDDKIKEYIKEFIICKECGKYDTELVKEGGHFYFVHCLACGAKHAVSYKT